MPDFNMKILVVDDMSTMRRIVKTTLKQLGYQDMEDAEDGNAALVKLREGGFQFVVSDWNMPNMSGIELLREIRKDEELKNIPVLMVTAEAKSDNVVEAIKAGVSNYIMKPFTAATLGEKIDKIFSKG